MAVIGDVLVKFAADFAEFSKGMQDSQKITFSGEGDQGPDIVPGDVVFVIEQKPHPRFERKGDDLYHKAEVDLLTALAGGTLAIEHLDERVLQVTILPGEVISPGMFLPPNPD